MGYVGREGKARLGRGLRDREHDLAREHVEELQAPCAVASCLGDGSVRVGRGAQHEVVGARGGISVEDPAARDHPGLGVLAGVDGVAHGVGASVGRSDLANGRHAAREKEEREEAIVSDRDARGQVGMHVDQSREREAALALRVLRPALGPRRRAEARFAPAAGPRRPARIAGRSHGGDPPFLDDDVHPLEATLPGVHHREVAKGEVDSDQREERDAERSARLDEVPTDPSPDDPRQVRDQCHLDEVVRHPHAACDLARNARGHRREKRERNGRSHPFPPERSILEERHREEPEVPGAASREEPHERAQRSERLGLRPLRVERERRGSEAGERRRRASRRSTSAGQRRQARGRHRPRGGIAKQDLQDGNGLAPPADPAAAGRRETRLARR